MTTEMLYWTTPTTIYTTTVPQSNHGLPTSGRSFHKACFEGGKDESGYYLRRSDAALAHVIAQGFVEATPEQIAARAEARAEAAAAAAEKRAATEAAVEAAKAAAAATAREMARDGGPATERQVDYIAALGVEIPAGYPLSKSLASTIISAVKGGEGVGFLGLRFTDGSN